MAGSWPADPAVGSLPKVHHAQVHRHESRSFQVRGDHPIQPAHEIREAAAGVGPIAQHGPRSGHDQGRRHAMPHDIA